MKLLTKICLNLAIIAILLHVQSNVMGAGNTLTSEDLDVVTSFDESQIYDSFQEIEGLVSLVNQNDAVTYDDLKADLNPLVNNVSSVTALAMNQDIVSKKFYFDSFVLGLGCGFIGILIVAVSNLKDPSQKTRIMSSVYGVVASIPVGLILYFISYSILYGG